MVLVMRRLRIRLAPSADHFRSSPPLTDLISCPFGILSAYSAHYSSDNPKQPLKHASCKICIFFQHKMIMQRIDFNLLWTCCDYVASYQQFLHVAVLLCSLCHSQ